MLGIKQMLSLRPLERRCISSATASVAVDRSSNKYAEIFLTPHYLNGITTHSEAARIDCAYLDSLVLQLITPNCPIYTASSEEAKTYPFPDPFWGFCWPGSYALCRFHQQYLETIRDRVVLDFAAGCGIASIVALQLGASAAIANDIDPWSCSAALLNAIVNLPPALHSSIHVHDTNLVGTTLQELEQITGFHRHDPSDWVILAGDVCYEEPLATQVVKWLDELAGQGVQVFLGDPGRQFLPKQHLRQVGSYALPPSLAQDNYGLPLGAVWTLQS
ncbi:hypothetical protein AC1031_006541 [Aphanomyces cochlioides]|nr:hypothetical protein AC1031_006541 [Aphanomyces cochlioides]